MSIRGDGAYYKSRMRSFNGYKYRAFGVIKAVNDYFSKENEESEPSSSATQPDILPIQEDKQFPLRPKFYRRAYREDW